VVLLYPLQHVLSREYPAEPRMLYSSRSLRQGTKGTTIFCGSCSSPLASARAHAVSLQQLKRVYQLLELEMAVSRTALKASFVLQSGLDRIDG
jgi:hypothetical protein